MGGDFAPGVNVKGALLALRDEPDLHLILVGPEELLLSELRAQKAGPSDRLTLVQADEVVSMEDHAASGIRKKKNSSIHVGLRLVKERKADAFVSAGNSGAVMAGALLILGRLADVERPAIVVKLPTAEGFVIILDAGANVDCKPSHLVQFAEMGHVFAKVIEGIAEPKIGVLSNGSEAHKGNELTRETYSLLKDRRDLKCVGYVEGYDLFKGTADVVVCDGFVGNVVLKLAEGLARSSLQWFRKEVRRDLLGLAGVVLMQRLLRRFKDKFDYEPYGAAPLLGIDGMVLISHGSSTEVAIRSGILTAKRGVEQKFTQKISAHLERQRAASVPQETNHTR
jgi:glycerol-3-phosphate acyltransferase PlsX